MTENPKLVIRDGQWLDSGEVYADYGDEELAVRLEQQVIDHDLIAALPDDEMGQSVRSPREAMYRASAAATHANNRGNVDEDGRVLVTVEDLEAAN